MHLMKAQAYRLIYLAALIFPMMASAANETPSSTLPRPTAVTDRSEMKPHLGLFAGAANPEGRDESRGEYGLDWGYQPYIPFGLGVEFSGTQVNGMQRTALLGRATYNFGGDIPVIKDTYVGVALGSVISSDGTRLASAPVVGFDIPLTVAHASYLSLGLTAKYLVIEGSTEDALSAGAAIKYWY